MHATANNPPLLPDTRPGPMVSALRYSRSASTPSRHFVSIEKRASDMKLGTFESIVSSASAPLLYRDLSEWYPLLTPAADHAEEACFYRRQFETHGHRPPRTLLDLGSGGGHNAAHRKATLTCTLVELAPAMLALSRRLNPACEHVQGDMRSIRLGRVFACVLLHDAVSYTASRADLASAIATAH